MMYVCTFVYGVCYYDVCMYVCVWSMLLRCMYVRLCMEYVIMMYVCTFVYKV